MISACMTVSVRELRTAVREWACWVVNVNMQYNGCLIAQQTLENGGTKGQHTRKIKGSSQPFYIT